METSVSNDQGRRLKELLAVRGLSQAALARKLDAGQSYVSNLVHGRQAVTIGLAERLRDELGVSPIWLLWGQGPVDAEAAERRLASLASEPVAAYHRARRLPVVGGGQIELPPGVQVYEVEGSDVEPIARKGERLLVVRAQPSDGGLGVVTLGHRRWRVIGKLY